MTQRFTIDGSDELEATLAHFCEEARKGVLAIIPERRVHALLLGGGYGRGEGGVLRTSNGDQPYNDLELYILLSGSDLLSNRLYAKPISHLAEQLTHQMGIEVEFKILALRKLERSPVTMFYYDLISGHRLLHGRDTWSATCQHHRAAHRIPLHEATRLLFNRCSGLLFSQEKLARTTFTAEDADFVGRNIAKARLALGDVLLVMRNQYHSSCRERHKRLRKLEAEGGLHGMEWILSFHAEGVEFKLHPYQSTQPPSHFQPLLDQVKECAAQLWLTLESRRLSKTFTDVFTYSFGIESKCPESNPFKNRLINARRFGPAALLDTSYPRERLLRSFPLLLWDPNALNQPESLACLQTNLRTSACSFPELISSYKSLWQIYN